MRMLAFLAAAAPAVLAGLAGSRLSAAGVGPWIFPVVAVVFALPLLGAKHRRTGLIVLGLVVSTVSGFVARQASVAFDAAHAGTPDQWPTFDLTKVPFPTHPPQWVTVRGYFRDNWTLDEYAVAAGGRPDQSKPPVAVLAPLVSTPEDVIRLDGAVVVGRVAPGRQNASGLTTIRGATRPLPGELMTTLVQISGATQPDQVEGFIVDTLEVPRDGGWAQWALSLVTGLIAAACYWVGVSAPRASTDLK